MIWVSWLNRGTNFSLVEREELRLEGLLPPVVESLDLQARAPLLAVAAAAARVSLRASPCVL